MGEPISGAWKRSVGYSGAAKWGTGINPIHAYRMGDARGGPNPIEAQLPEGYTPAHMGTSEYRELGPEDSQYGLGWGYQTDDIAGLDSYGIGAITGEVFHQDDWPDWTKTTPDYRAEPAPGMSRPWQAGNAYKQWRRLLYGVTAFSFDDSMRSTKTPTETVNEGWLNKPASGRLEDGYIPDANTSDPSQYERQTSMQQRYAIQENTRAVMRSGPEGQADTAREPIESRVVPMKIKEYSTGERLYDMTPREQTMVPRGFNYRTAGVGPSGYLETNDQHVRTALQRTPPPDPSLGTPDTELSTTEYGYQYEDQGWY